MPSSARRAPSPGLRPRPRLSPSPASSTRQPLQELKAARLWQGREKIPLPLPPRSPEATLGPGEPPQRPERPQSPARPAPALHGPGVPRDRALRLVSALQPRGDGRTPGSCPEKFGTARAESPPVPTAGHTPPQRSPGTEPMSGPIPPGRDPARSLLRAHGTAPGTGQRQPREASPVKAALENK